MVKGSGRKVRDPRFDELCGRFSPQIFQHAYAFVDELRDKEIEENKKILKKVRNKERKMQLEAAVKEAVSLR